MASMRVKSRALLPAGVVAAVATAVSGWAPVAQSAPSAPARDTGVRAPAADASDGTFESCAAYFGFGKEQYGVLDVVAFDVADQNGADGVAHAVPTDTHVVLELTNDEGDVLECAPEEVTEAEWDAAMDDIGFFMPEGSSYPAWPGPGHYAYPSVSFEPFIEDFGTVVDVAFKVTASPDGHTLVSPVDVTPLVPHYVTDGNFLSFVADPRVLGLIESEAGAGPRAAFASALTACDAGEPDAATQDLVDAINVLNAYRGYDPQPAEAAECFNIGLLNNEVSVLLGIVATSTYVENIVLALPVEPTTTTTTSTTPSSTTQPTTPTPVPPAVAAGAVPGSPTYTG